MVAPDAETSRPRAPTATFCTSGPADAGARVIKIERDRGDLARKSDEVAHGESAYFVWLNRSKESLTLYSKGPEDAALAARQSTSRGRAAAADEASTRAADG